MSETAERIRLANARVVSAFVDEMVRSGVRHFSVAPGSRSTPLAIAIARHPAARLWMHLDERSAGFFALGIAKQLQEPVALVCTSGTAAANFLPAVVEAFYAGVPLVVLTADRPHELRDRGAAQTIDQARLYGSHVRWFFDLEESDLTDQTLRHARTVASRAASVARGAPAGPVHINCPYREPLDWPASLVPSSWDGSAAGVPLVAAVRGQTMLEASDLVHLRDCLLSATRGLIVAGPQAEPSLAPPLGKLATRLGWPVLADPLSGLRYGPHERGLVVDAYDAFLRNAAVAADLEPDLVLHFGAVPTSKPATQYLERWAAVPHIFVDPDATWNEPTDMATDLLQVDAAPLAAGLLASLVDCAAAPATEPDWPRRWTAINSAAREALASHFAGQDEWSEGKVYAQLDNLLPDGATLFVGNSMPVRDLDSFFPATAKRIRVLCNRGANGIDGVVSAALGASAVADGPLVLAIGDVSFYHDSNGLLASRRHGLNATIVLINNDGGGIFSFLGQAEQQDVFEPLFGTPHGLDLRSLAATYGIAFQTARDWSDFDRLVQRSITEGGVNVVEVRTNRQQNVVQHRAAWQAVNAALAQLTVPAR